MPFVIIAIKNLTIPTSWEIQTSVKLRVVNFTTNTTSHYCTVTIHCVKNNKSSGLVLVITELMWLPGTHGVKERRRRANQQRGVGRVRKDEEIQQKPTTRHQAGKQGVNQAASPGLGAKTEGEVGQIWRSLHRINLAQIVDPDKSPPNQVGRGCCSQLGGGLSKSHLPLHPGWWWSKGTNCAGKGSTAWTRVHLALGHQFCGISTQVVS